MLEVTIDASGIDRAAEMLKRWPDRLLEALRRANANSAAHVLGKIKGEKLTGQALHRRTGNLIRSWAVIPPVREEGGWKGGVGSNSSYAAAHEFGVDVTQTVAVRAYTRRQNSRNTFRKSAANYRRGGTGVVQSSQGIAFVHAFQRAQHTRLPARPYARPALRESIERIRATHRDEIRQAWEKAK